MVKTGTNHRREALFFAHYLDGAHDDHKQAATAASMMGIFYLYDLDWQGLRSIERI